MTNDSRQADVETEGKVLSNRFQPSKARTIANLQAALESFLAARNLSREYLAENVCGMSLPNFSKVSNGLQGDFVRFVNEKLPADIREDFYDREQEDRQHDPVIAAVETLMQAAFTVLRLASAARGLPTRADHMARVEPRRKAGAA
jgi:hypothetical protein